MVFSEEPNEPYTTRIYSTAVVFISQYFKYHCSTIYTRGVWFIRFLTKNHLDCRNAAYLSTLGTAAWGSVPEDNKHDHCAIASGTKNRAYGYPC